jgi:mgtE-like transporter
VVLAVAGVVIELHIDDFSRRPALLILLPAVLSGAGAVGGILSSRLSTKLHLGLVTPRPVPDRVARGDLRVSVVIALPVFLFVGVLAHVSATLTDLDGPGMTRLVAIAVVGGMLTVLAAMAIAYYGTVAATRFGVDPDTYGIPLVSSTVDLAGAYALVLAIALFAGF